MTAPDFRLDLPAPLGIDSRTLSWVKRVADHGRAGHSQSGERRRTPTGHRGFLFRPGRVDGHQHRSHHDQSGGTGATSGATQLAYTGSSPWLAPAVYLGGGVAVDGRSLDPARRTGYRHETDSKVQVKSS